MGNRSDLVEILRAIAAEGRHPAIGQVFEAIVISVEGVTCTVEIEGLQIDGVRLRATEEQGEGILIEPMVGSVVLVGLIGDELSTLYIVRCNNYNKIRVSRGNVTLSAVLSDLVDVLNTFKVVTSSGPSTAVSPDTLSKIALLDTKLKTLLGN